MASDVVAHSGLASYDDLLNRYINGELREIFEPIQALVSPGNKVVLKPNFVKESHLERKDEWEQIITHGTVIECTLRETIRALHNTGEIAIIDAPQTDSDYQEIISRIDLAGMVSRLQAETNVKLSYFDLREERWFFQSGIIVKKKKLKGDPLGYTTIDLGTDSCFAPKKNKNYYGADYDREETARYHDEHHNIYVISNTVLACDVLINLPKMKTHKLGGITCCLKNIVGTCVIKNSLPHHTLGYPQIDGDQFEKPSGKTETEGWLKRSASRILRHKIPFINYPFILLKKIGGRFLGSAQSETVRNGSWYGNDTIWRTTLDLNRILIYADKSGAMHDIPQRKIYAVVDALLAGEGNGPMAADSVHCGLLLSGNNLVSIDATAAVIMGFNPNKIPTLNHSFEQMKYPLTDCILKDIRVHCNMPGWNKLLSQFTKEDVFHFRPHFGWVGHLERSSP